EGQPGRRADMVPLAVMDDGAQPSCRLGAVVEADEREFRRERAGLGEEPAMQELDAGEEEGRRLALAAAARQPERIEEVVAGPVIAEGGRRFLQQQHGVGLVLAPGAREARQRRHLAVEPQDVAVDDEEALVEQRQRLDDAAARFQQLALLREENARRGAGTEMPR